MNARLFNSVFALAVLLMLAGLAGHKYLHNWWFKPALSFEREPVLAIEAGTSTSALVNRLERRGIIRSALLAKIGQRVFAPDFVLKRGEYQLPDQLSLAELFELLDAGVSTQYRITLVEGKTVAELAALFAKDEFLDRDIALENNIAISWLALLSDEARGMMPGKSSAEGWFFPDTYYFARGDRASEILGRAHRKMLAELKQAWAERKDQLPYKTAYEALVMASLIERETGAVEEQRDIAGVFVRRLQKKMRLQTDPTVIYGMGERYDGNLRRADLKRDTPYNTYTRHGLPPTPIAAPGLGAIRAALDPADGTALYFVAKGNGRHHFSDTLQEHQEAVQHYQVLNRRSDYRSSPAQSPAGD